MSTRNDYPNPLPEACRDCVHLLDFAVVREQVRPRCRAFPVGVPDAVLDGTLDHRTPIDGDQGFQFEPLVHSATEAEQTAFDLAVSEGRMLSFLSEERAANKF